MNLSITNLYARLKEYENTGLEPEEIANLLCEAISLKKELDEYTTAKRKGHLLILPCGVGDTLWDRNLEPWNVISVEYFSKKVTRVRCVSPVTAVKNTFSIGKRSLGKTIFLSREEAEEALRKGELVNL